MIQKEKAVVGSRVSTDGTTFLLFKISESEEVETANGYVFYV